MPHAACLERQTAAFERGPVSNCRPVMSAFGGKAHIALRRFNVRFWTQSGHSASNFAVTHKAALTQDDHGHDHLDFSQAERRTKPGDQEPTCSRAMRREGLRRTSRSCRTFCATTKPGSRMSSSGGNGSTGPFNNGTGCLDLSIARSNCAQ